MMPNLTTPVLTSQMPFKIDFASGIVSMGSCFADEIGCRLQESDFHVELNPFGALYNPASMASALHRLIENRPIDQNDLVKHEGLWHSWHHHGSFSHPTTGATLTACNSRIHRAHQALKEANVLMLTFGTAWVYELKGVNGSEEGVNRSEMTIVSNCHKLPPDNFVRRRMTIEEIVALWQPLLQELETYYPALNIIFSVSPIRHLADGAHGNQLSKSTLLLAIDELITHHSSRNIFYFPAYEIVLDELRDYRYFDEKMTHPTPLAVDIVWERFQHSTMTPGIRQQAHFNMKQHKQEKHIPLYKV